MTEPSRLKILIIRLSSIGDIVLTTPVIRCLKQQIGAEIHYVIKPHYKSILEANPYIDKLHLLKPKLKDTITDFKAEGYTHIIDLHNNLRSFQIKRGLKDVPSHSFYKMNIEKWLIVNLGINLLQKRHIVDRYFDTVKHLGVNNDDKGLDYFLIKNDIIDKNTLPDLFKAGFIAFAIGGTYKYKKLPNSKIIDICGKLNRPVILLGGKEDEENARIISQKVGKMVLNTCGQYTINQSASIVQQADAVVTHDTGMMHIAAAFKKKVISIWGATIPEFGMSPYKPGEGSVIIEPKGGSFRPYSKLGNHRFYKGRYTGMYCIDVDEVVEAALG